MIKLYITSIAASFLFSFIPGSRGHEMKDANHPLRELELNESVQVTIHAKNPRDSTGVRLRSSCTYMLVVTPCGQTWEDGWLKPFTADGRFCPHFTVIHLFKRMPGVKWFALIGSIDNKRSSFFKTGSFKSNFSPECDGELVCFANDVGGLNDYWYRHNNSGEIKLLITRIK